MAYLKNHHYKVLPLGEVVDAIKAGKHLPFKSVVITFDDGYEDNYTEAYPILKKYGFTATIFLISDSINTDGFLKLEQIRDMLAHNINFGAHTRTHAYLPGVSTQQRRDEIFGSKKILEEQLGVKISNFAYPTGGFNDEIKKIVEEAGYASAVTTNRGHDRFNHDLYELKRVRLSDHDTRNDYLWSKLSGFYNLFRKLKEPSSVKSQCRIEKSDS